MAPEARQLFVTFRAPKRSSSSTAPCSAAASAPNASRIFSEVSTILTSPMPFSKWGGVCSSSSESIRAAGRAAGSSEVTLSASCP
eukprot:scaffold529_cov308-Pinguiococcus_pyrenoidosus.AAC.80